MDIVVDQPWTRKHDDPRAAYIPRAPRIAYPTSLKDLIALCRARHPDDRLKAAGSHWALSEAAVSDVTFIETHDPGENHDVMGRTLTDVVPGCLRPEYLDYMAERASIDKWYLVHVEAGKRIYQAYAELDRVVDVDDITTLAGRLKHDHHADSFGGPWAFATLGGAGGQTVVGAVSTGTHGGDFDRPPLADSVVALHLVTDGGRHHWIEPADAAPTMTDDVALRTLYGSDEYGGLDNFEVIRDTKIFNAALVSVGRFGVIYSVVLKVVPQYALWEKRRLHVWQDIKELVKDPGSSLYADPLPPPGVLGQQRYLQVAVSLTSHANFLRNLAGVTRRWDTPVTASTAGHAQRVGSQETVEDDPHLHAPRFDLAGRSHAYSPDDDNQHKAAGTSFIESACSDGSFVRGAISAALTELEQFVDTHKVVTGSGLAAVVAVGGEGLLALLAELVAVLAALALLLETIDEDARFGEVMESVKNTLLDPMTSAVARPAGLLAWQLIYYKVFASKQSERDYDAQSYAVMDDHDYLNVSCDVNVDSIEVFFDATDDRLIAFIDALLLFETNQEFHGKACIGYASLRFTQPTRATIGMQQWPRSCAVEVACLKDVTGGEDLIDFAVAWARNPNSGALLHWGQRNDWTSDEVNNCFGSRVQDWRRALAGLTNHGTLNGFSSAFTKRTGLEVLE